VQLTFSSRISSHDSFGSRLCENAAKTLTRRHHGSPWLLIGLADQQGLQ
jgi:hypothetical protein